MTDNISPYDFGFTYGTLGADVIGWASDLQQSCPVAEGETFPNGQSGGTVLARGMQIDPFHLRNMQTCFQVPVFSICLLSP